MEKVEKEFIIKCQDGCSLVLVQKDPEEGGFIEFACYELGSKDDHTISWRYKWKWIKYFLKTGRPYSDWMLLNKNEAIKFRDGLNSLIQDGK